MEVLEPLALRFALLEKFKFLVIEVGLRSLLWLPSLALLADCETEPFSCLLVLLHVLLQLRCAAQGKVNSLEKHVLDAVRDLFVLHLKLKEPVGHFLGPVLERRHSLDANWGIVHVLPILRVAFLLLDQQLLVLPLRLENRFRLELLLNLAAGAGGRLCFPKHFVQQFLIHFFFLDGVFHLPSGESRLLYFIEDSFV